jgi:hypothetical protein
MTDCASAPWSEGTFPWLKLLQFSRLWCRAEGAKLWHGARTRRAMYSRKAERNRMTGFQTSLRIFGIGRTYQGKQSHGTRLRPWGSARHAPLQNGQPSRSSSNSALIPRRPSSNRPQTSPSSSKPKSGSSPSLTANVIPLNRRLSTTGDTPWTSGCARFSVTSSLRIYTTLP